MSVSWGKKVSASPVLGKNSQFSARQGDAYPGSQTSLKQFANLNSGTEDLSPKGWPTPLGLNSPHAGSPPSYQGKKPPIKNDDARPTCFGLGACGKPSDYMHSASHSKSLVFNGYNPPAIPVGNFCGVCVRAGLQTYIVKQT
ncbi:hypothetical protein Bbelb_258070 [Branchiostoma belcheri]|nr:hypothetical protein Bbelb_258070 [Branchiostoma belcheri]